MSKCTAATGCDCCVVDSVEVATVGADVNGAACGEGSGLMAGEEKTKGEGTARGVATGAASVPLAMLSFSVEGGGRNENDGVVDGLGLALDSG